VIGGLLFGYDMALSGNCGYGALARLGGGDLRALMIALVMGLSAYIVLSGPLAQARIWLFPVQTGAAGTQGLTQVLAGFGVAPLITGLAVSAALLAVVLGKPGPRLTAAHGVWGAVVGLAVVSGWVGTYWVATTGFEAEPIETHTFAAPIGDTIFYSMTASGTALSFGVGSVVGVVLGAALGSLFKRQFRWEACEDPRELKRQMLGAAMMGPGAVLAVGCSIGQGLSLIHISEPTRPY